MRRWWTAAELAEARLPGLPETRPAASAWIAEACATDPGTVRARSGRGGGLEVSIRALPATAHQELARREASAADTATAVVVRDTAGSAPLASARPMGARQRLMMEARAALLVEIDQRVMLTGHSLRAVVTALAEDVGRGRESRDIVELIERAKDKLGDEDRAQRLRKGVSWRTLYRWHEARQTRGVAALAPKLAAEAQALPPWFGRFMRYYARPSKPPVTEALERYCATLPAGTPHPSLDQVRRGLAKLTPLERAAGREGQLALRARLAYTSRDTSDLLPTSVYIADGKTFDAEVAHPQHGHPFRPELTTILDVATRRCVGWSAALDESTHAVVDALRRACAEGGIPALFYTDNGPGYRNAAMEAPLTGFMGRAGITPMRARAYNAQAKGIVERFNGTVWVSAARALPTYLGRDMDREARKRVFTTTRRELALVGGSALLPGWDAFLEAVAQAIAVYNARPHTSLPRIRDTVTGKLRHRSPDEEWAARCDGFEPVVPEAAELEDMWRPHVERTVRRSLVEWLGNSYFSPDLEPFHGETVVVGYDVRDATRVWVREIEIVDGERHPGRLLAVAIFEGHKTRYVPLSAEQDAMEKRAKGRLARLDRKRDLVERELRPTALLEMSPSASPPPLIDAVPTLPPKVPSPPRLGPGGRPLFRHDIDLLRWLSANPDRATAADRVIVAEYLTQQSGRDELRVARLDVEILRAIARGPIFLPSESTAAS